MWTNFYLAAAGASATLAGLVIVAISVNLQPILQYPHLPTRAGATIARFILILVSCIAALIPQRPAALGIEMILFALVCWELELQSTRQGIQATTKLGRPRWEWTREFLLGQLQVLPFLIAGILTLAGRSTGPYFLAAGALMIFVFATLNAWVLLVEILR